MSAGSGPLAGSMSPISILLYREPSDEPLPDHDGVTALSPISPTARRVYLDTARLRPRRRSASRSVCDTAVAPARSVDDSRRPSSLFSIAPGSNGSLPVERRSLPVERRSLPARRSITPVLRRRHRDHSRSTADHSRPTVSIFSGDFLALVRGVVMDMIVPSPRPAAADPQITAATKSPDSPASAPHRLGSCGERLPARAGSLPPRARLRA